MEFKCHPIPNPWPISSCSAGYWGVTIIALIFTYQYHKSATALCSQLEKNTITSPDDCSGSGFGSGSSRRQSPPLSNNLNLSLRTWRVAAYLVFLSQTLLALFAAQSTYSWIHTLHQWASRQESGSRPVIMQVPPPDYLTALPLPSRKEKEQRLSGPLSLLIFKKNQANSPYPLFPLNSLNALLLCIWIMCILHLLVRGYISLIQNAVLFHRMSKTALFRYDMEMELPSPSPPSPPPSPPSCGRNAIEKIRVENPSGPLL